MTFAQGMGCPDPLLSAPDLAVTLGLCVPEFLSF